MIFFKYIKLYFVLALTKILKAIVYFIIPEQKESKKAYSDDFTRYAEDYIFDTTRLNGITEIRDLEHAKKIDEMFKKTYYQNKKYNFESDKSDKVKVKQDGRYFVPYDGGFEN